MAASEGRDNRLSSPEASFSIAISNTQRSFILCIAQHTRVAKHSPRHTAQRAFFFVRRAGISLFYEIFAR